MSQWRVRDVMATAADDALFAEVAATLVGGRISGVPIVDRFDAVVGVVSWTDLREKIDVGEPGDDRCVGWRRRRVPALPRWSGGTAVQVMSAPPVAIGPDALRSFACPHGASRSTLTTLWGTTRRIGEPSSNPRPGSGSDGTGRARSPARIRQDTRKLPRKQPCQSARSKT